MSRGAHRSCVRRNEPSFANFKSKERRKEDCTRSEESKTAARRSPPNSVSSSCAAPRAQVFFMKMTFCLLPMLQNWKRLKKNHNGKRDIPYIPPFRLLFSLQIPSEQRKTIMQRAKNTHTHTTHTTHKTKKVTPVGSIWRPPGTCPPPTSIALCTHTRKTNITHSHTNVTLSLSLSLSLSHTHTLTHSLTHTHTVQHWKWQESQQTHPEWLLWTVLFSHTLGAPDPNRQAAPQLFAGDASFPWAAGAREGERDSGYCRSRYRISLTYEIFFQNLRMSKNNN